MRIVSVITDLLLGLLCSLLAAAVTAVTFSTDPGLLTVLAPALSILPLTGLLYSPKKSAWITRSVTALLGFVPAGIAEIRFGLHQAVFAACNPAYAAEYGGPNTGDSFGLVFVHAPIAFAALCIAALAAARLRARKASPHSII